MPPGCRPANPSGTVGGEETWKRINAGKDMDRYRRYMKDQIGELLTIYGCTEEKFVAPPGTVLTFNPATRRLYIHLLAYPGGRLACPFAADVAYAQLVPPRCFRNHAGASRYGCGADAGILQERQ